MADQFDITLLGGANRGGTFPAGMNTSVPPTDLRPDETPDSYNLDLTKDNRIAVGSVPTGTARVRKTTTISGNSYLWHYRRVWRADGTDLIYGAPDYNDVYYPQRNGKIPFDEDSNSIIAFLPFGQDSIFVAKSTGSYVVANCLDSRALFLKSDIIQEMRCSNASNIVELDGVVYVSNSSGVFAYRNGAVTEITRKVRDNVTNYANVALTCDYEKKYVIGASAFVYEPATDKIYDYQASGFRYTTPQFRMPDWRPFAVDRLIFTIEHSDTEDGSLTYQYRIDDDTWSEEVTVLLPYRDEQYNVVTDGLDNRRNASRFQVRLTSLTSTKYIRSIRIDHNQTNFDDYRR